MFAEILNGRIVHYRGDTLSTPIHIYSGDKFNKEPYELKDNEKLYFGILEPHQAFEDAIVRKVYDSTSKKDDDGNVLLELGVEDTEYLMPGQYYYMAKLVSVDGDDIKSVDTIIPAKSFEILGGTPYEAIDKENYEIPDGDIIYY